MQETPPSLRKVIKEAHVSVTNMQSELEAGYGPQSRLATLPSQQSHEIQSIHDTFFVALSAHCNIACLLLRIHPA